MGKKTHNYFINCRRCFCFNTHPDGKLSGSFYLASHVNDDQNFAVESTGRDKSCGKRIDLSECGNTDRERFNYHAKLILQAWIKLSLKLPVLANFKIFFAG